MLELGSVRGIQIWIDVMVHEMTKKHVAELSFLRGCPLLRLRSKRKAVSCDLVDEIPKKQALKLFFR